MKTFFTLIVVLIVVVLLGSVYLVSKNSYQRVLGQSTVALVPSSMPSGSPVNQEKFSSSPNFPYANQIFPGVLSTKAKQVLANFVMQTQTLSNGDMEVTLTPKEKEDQKQQYTVKKGETLYFIEKSPNDDSNIDNYLPDDFGVIVDASGNIVSP